MSINTTQRKTYMMLSKENAVSYIVEPNTHKVINKFETEHETKNKEDSVDKNNIFTTTYTTVKNAMYTFRFPEAFINSKNKRWVEIHHCKVLYNDNEVTDLVLHSDIVQRDPYLDHTIMNVNETRTKYKKYEYTQQKQYFTIWFTSFAHPEKKIENDKITFLCEMMLIY